MTTDASIRADSWLEDARAKLGAIALGPNAEQIGRVEEVGDGIALVSGLPNVGLDELLRFDKGQFGFAQVLERDRVGCVLFDDVDAVEAGDIVRGTGDVVRVPVGPALLGRVVDPLGRPLDGKGPVVADTLEPIERSTPAIIDRDLVIQPVQTGLVVVDTLFALGRGQRELIVGDRAIGKTTIAIDTIIDQKASDMVCVYVAVGQKSSSVRRAIDAIHGGGAPERCIIVVAGSASSAGLQWIAPFASFTMAEYFPLWVGLRRPSEAGPTAAALAISGVQNHGSEPRSRVDTRPSLGPSQTARLRGPAGVRARLLHVLR